MRELKVKTDPHKDNESWHLMVVNLSLTRSLHGGEFKSFKISQFKFECRRSSPEENSITICDGWGGGGVEELQLFDGTFPSFSEQ